MAKRRTIESDDAKAARLRAHLLEQQIEHNLGRLATTAEHLDKHGRKLDRFRWDLRRVMRSSADMTALVDSLQHHIDDLPKDNLDWPKLDEAFVAAYRNTRSKIAAAIPNLSDVELSICVLMRMRFTGLEIARLLNLSARSLTARIRHIRTTLGAQHGDDIYLTLAAVS